MRRVKDVWRYARLWTRLALEMEELWLQTRPRSALEQLVIQELRRRHAHIQQWRDVRVTELQHTYRRAAILLKRVSSRTACWPRSAIPSRGRLWLRRWNCFDHSLTDSRQALQHYWRESWMQLKRGRLHNMRVHRLVFTLAQEMTLFTMFISAFFKQLIPHLFGTVTASRR